jgi:hypothetical protein
MSPRAKHIPDNASKTTIRLTDEEMAAINWIRISRNQKGNDRKTLNDVLVDGLWLLLNQEEGKTRDEIQATIPQRQTRAVAQDNVTRMPKPKRK